MVQMGRGLKLASIGFLLTAGLFAAMSRVQAEPLAYLESEYDLRMYRGDDDFSRARAHFIHGDYGLAELYYLRAVEATKQNSAAWAGLAASYDRIGRYDLAARAYRQAYRLGGTKFVLLNNQAYGRLLRGDRHGALRLFYEAQYLAPADPTIANNIMIAQEGQAYFWNGQQ
jgi:Flp pilus assembly protein TadD